MSKLGRGLSALIPDKSIDRNNLKIEDLCPGKFQQRKNFDDNKLEDLAGSIRASGVIQPIIVRKKEDKYEIIAGERRTRASEIAGLTEIPAIIVSVDDRKALEMSIIENIQRDDLNVVEEAQGYKNLIEEFHYLQEELSKVVGKSRSYITNCLRMLSLPDEIKVLLKRKDLSVGHARALVGIENAVQVAQEIVRRSLNVRQTESLIKRLNGKKEITEKTEEIIELEKKVSERLGLEVKINDSKGNSSVVIKFENLKQLSLVLKKLSAGDGNIEIRKI